MNIDVNLILIVVLKFLVINVICLFCWKGSKVFCWIMSFWIFVILKFVRLESKKLNSILGWDMVIFEFFVFEINLVILFGVKGFSVVSLMMLVVGE